MFACPTHALEEAAKEQKPVLSEQGKRRLAENLGILTDNIERTKRNLDTSKENLKVVQEELADLEKLEKEHKALQSQYDKYLESASSELQQNDAAVTQLAADGKTASQSEKSADELKRIQSEKEDRASWRVDTVQKIQKVQGLRAKLESNLQNIQSRRGPLHADLKTWTDRQQQYETLLTQLTNRKSSLEKLAQK